MSVHEEIVSAIDRVIASNDAAIVLLPATVALRVQKEFHDGPLQHHIQYTSLEHLKQMARRRLSARYDADGEENEVHDGQQELFTGQLQNRYPIPRQRGQEPQYKLREHLSYAEVQWNVEQLRKSARARMAHADAMEAWGMSRREAA